MPSHRTPLPRWILLLAGCAAVPAGADPLGAAEARYADWLDAGYAAATLAAAGGGGALDGRDEAAWRARAAQLRATLLAELPVLDASLGGRGPRRVLAALEHGLATPPDTPAAATPAESAERCAAAGAARSREALGEALYACFEHHGNHLAFEGATITRTTALQLLGEIDDPARRAALFRAFAPLWAALHGDGGDGSPYRRLIRLSAAGGGADGEAVQRAARTVGVPPATAERWLVRLLAHWRARDSGPAVEPWDYWYRHMAPLHALDAEVPATAIAPLSARYYADLGADLAALGVEHDLGVRAGKAPLSYADYVRIGRDVDGRWRAARTRVSSNVEHGGLLMLNEIIHEDGHAVHMAAVRTRPAFYGLGDDLFLEAFADVPAWSVADPGWQRRYLADPATARDGRRALYASVMLDVAWGLFEMRMLRQPDTDPNALWSEITSRYLNVRPHPELAWWALRVQLVDTPGYLLNYGLGAVLTADLRARTRAAIGAFDAGNPRWYPWLSARLLRYGASLQTSLLLRRFLGRPPGPAALLAELDRLAPLPP